MPDGDRDPDPDGIKASYASINNVYICQMEGGKSVVTVGVLQIVVSDAAWAEGRA